MPTAEPPSEPTPAAARQESPTVHATMRSANMSLALRHLRRHGGRSRARLAQETGLSKAAVTSLIAELTARGLVREGKVRHDGTVGRPGTEVELDPDHVAGIGVELNVDYIAVCVLDLAGTVRSSTSTPLPVADPGPAPTVPGSPTRAAVLERAAERLRAALALCADLGLWVAGVTIAPPGVIDAAGTTVRFASNLGWADVPVAAEIGRHLGAGHPPIRLENDAKLSALAEAPVLGDRGITDLVYLTGDVGVGAGIVADGRLLRGWAGLSGEVGHMTMEPGGALCRCGRRGCWETQVGFEVLLDALTQEDPARSPHRPMLERLGRIRELLQDHDAAVTRRFAEITRDLARGVGVLVDVLNPRAVVLGGYFGYFSDLLIEPLERSLAAGRFDETGRVAVTAATFGLDTAARGGAAAALEGVLADPYSAPRALPTGT